MAAILFNGAKAKPFEQIVNTPFDTRFYLKTGENWSSSFGELV